MDTFRLLRALHSELQGRVDASKLAAIWRCGDDVRDLTAERGALKAEVERLKAAATLVIEMAPAAAPDPAFDDWGCMIADTPERHADRVLETEKWEIACILRAALKEKGDE